MKKILLSIICALMSLVGMAQTFDFSGYLVVSINEEMTDPQRATIQFTLNEDFTCDFALNNFMLDDGENVMPVGNIKIQNLPLVPLSENEYMFTYMNNLVISAGDAAGYSEDDWLGPMLGEIPLQLRGTVNALTGEMMVSIDIDMQETLGQNILVAFISDSSLGPADEESVDFTDDLVVTINGESTEPQQTTVTLSINSDYTVNFSLKNFMLDDGENVMPVGDILVKNLVPRSLDEEGNVAGLSFDGTIEIAAGDAEGYGEDDWLGPMLGEIPLKLDAKVTDEKIFVTIDIDMQETLEQHIYVTFGHDFEIGEDAIEPVVADAVAKSGIFDIQGRRVQKAGRGLYIVNGKKVLKK